MTFEPLFLTSRVVVALYRTLSTTVLLYYLVKRMNDGKPPRDHHHGRYN
jgi:hypothetical protein